MTRRILEIVGTLDPCGPQKQLLLLAGGLPRDRFEVHVAALSPGTKRADFARQGIDVAVMGDSCRRDPGVWLRLRQHVKRLKPDVVHTWAGANTWGRLAALAAGARLLVATLHNGDSPHSLPFWALNEWLARRTSVVIVDTPIIAQQVARTHFEKVRCIAPAVEPCPPSDLARQQLLDELHLASDTRLIATIAPLEWSSRIKDLIWAADLLKVIRHDTHLLVIGEGSMRAGLERYRRLCRIDERVHFLGFRHDLARLLPHIDLLWQAGKRESLSMAILEAMAAGVPVVAAETPTNCQLIAHGENGFLVPLGDRAGFGRQANKLLNDSALARRLGAAAQRRIVQDFKVESMVEKHAAVYGGG